ncbi:MULTISPECIES: DsbA family protein [Marinomonas]|uniref:Protein-disulfide isomerase n=1 Tax=Marinomonas fungiae TaxID=1137284 RepID=A0A0K6IUD0_9GAMM|nr:MULTISPECIES: thioredoxin domain-containing protein [Marinomonas]CUB06721.1 Protein-disulfide isomerase [Marinomonas fungiae]
MLKRITAVAAIAGLLVLPSAYAEQSPKLTYDGQQYQGDTLPPALKQSLNQLAQQYNDQRRQAVDQYALNRYVQEEASRQSKDVKTLQQELMAVADPTEEQLKGFYEANKARIQGTFEQVKPELVNYLKRQQMTERAQQLLEQIALKKGYRVELPEPEQLRLDVATKGYPSKGNPDAKITLVEFADYQCPHCKNAVEAVDALLKQYGDKLRVVYRDFPINQSGISRKVAEAAVCADQQGQFWKFHDLAFERQNYLKSIPVDALAKEADLDMGKFGDCYQDAATQAKVTASLNEARELGLSGTPSFFVNGRPLGNTHGDLLKDLKELIDEELQAGS